MVQNPLAPDSSRLYEDLPDWERTARVLQPMLATLFFFSALRLFVAELSVHIYPTFGLAGALLAVVIVLSSPAFAILLRRYCSHPLVISAIPTAMALARLAGQVFNRPEANWISAGAVIFLYGLFLPLYAGWLASRERRGIYALAWGILASVPVDLCLRALFASADPFFTHGMGALAAVVVMGLFSASRTLTWPRRPLREPIVPLADGGWSAGFIFAGIGPLFLLGYALYLNPSLAGPLANAAYPASVVTMVSIGALVGSALYYDADSVRLLDLNPRATAIVANLALLVITGALLFHRPSHWNLPLMAIGLAAILIDIVLYARMLVSRRGNPVNAAGLGLLLGFFLLFALLAPILLWNMEWTLLIGAGVTAITGVMAGRQLGRSPSPARVVRPASWVWAAAVVLLILAAGALFIQPAGAHPDPRDEIVLMSYNIRGGFGADDAFNLRRTAEAIMAADADIIALQEVNRGAPLNGFTDDIIVLMDILRPAGYRYWVFGPAAGPAYGNAIISRYPIVASENYPYQARELETRACLAARVKIGGRRLAVYSTHLTHVAEAGEARLAQTEELLAIIAPEGLPKAIMGNFNAAPDSPAIGRIAGTYPDAYAVAGKGPGCTFRSDAPAERIDYIFISPELTALSAAVGESMASDHLPVIVRVSLPR